MEKQDWLLLPIGDQIEPIQIQKVLFLFAQEPDVPQDEAYEFVPYNWGPCSFQIYDDLGKLRTDGLIEQVPTGRGWNTYRLTEAGKARARELRAKAEAKHVAAMARIREWVASRDFETLLRDVYKKYPSYATQSMFTKR